MKLGLIVAQFSHFFKKVYSVHNNFANTKSFVFQGKLIISVSTRFDIHMF